MADRVPRRTAPAARRTRSNVPGWTAVSGSSSPSPSAWKYSRYVSRWTRFTSATVAGDARSTSVKGRLVRGGKRSTAADPAAPHGRARTRGRGTEDRRRARSREGRGRLQGIDAAVLGPRDELITIENHAAKHLRIVTAPLSKLDFICSIQERNEAG